MLMNLSVKYIKRFFSVQTVFLTSFMLVLTLVNSGLVKNYAYASSEQGLVLKSLTDNYNVRLDPETTKAVISFLKENPGHSLWLQNRKAEKISYKSVTAINILQDSWTHGLNPGRYNIEQIRSIAYTYNPEKAQLFETLLTLSFTKFLQDLSGFTLQNADAHMINPEYWQPPLDAQNILDMLNTTDDLQKLISRIQPGSGLYKAMRIKLTDLVEKLEANRYSYSRNTLAYNGDNSVPGAYGKNVDKSGDSSAIEEQIRQLIVNLERARWIKRERPERYIVVNTAASRLWGIDKDGVRLDMPVVVGQPDRKTISFNSTITGVRINPTWTVPKSVKKYDFLPVLQSNPSALTTKNIELYEAGAMRSLDPEAVDWNALKPENMHRFTMVQRSGQGNPLGRIRFLMPNKYNIFIHDTNKPDLFNYAYRAYSSGCIRASRIDDLAHFVMEGTDGWSEDRLREIIESGRTRDVPARDTLDVFIMYMTIWFDNQGSLVFAKDVYDKDNELFSYMHKQGRTPHFISGKLEEASLNLPLTSR